MLVPEIILYNTLNLFLDLVYKDWDEADDKSKTILYELFNKDDNKNCLEFETYNWLDQAKSMFLRDAEDVRRLSVNIGWNPTHINTPTVHILMPSESKGVIDSIGKDEHAEYNEECEIQKTTKTQSFRSSYHLMITSDNASEVLLVYYFFRTIFLLYHEQFEFLGLRDLQFTGEDINVAQDMAPPHIYNRNISLTFDYESSVTISLNKPAMKRFRAIFCTDIHLDYNKFNNAKGDPNIHDGLDNDLSELYQQ